MIPLPVATLPDLRRRLKPFWALSRTPHGLIDMAAPMAAALLCLGAMPPLPVILVGLVTVFAGYTAVYALNDLVDFQADRRKVALGGYRQAEAYLDGVLLRHPLAQGALSFKAGLAWACAWGALALLGAFWLNPVCVAIFAAGCLLEAVYCLLWRVSPWRAAVNGVVKTLGPLAAVYAVNPAPAPLFVAVLFLWLFFWEIGGQNIPCDWTDIAEDRRFKAQTIPVKLGPRRAGLIAVVALVLALFLHVALLWVSPLAFGGLFLAVAVAVNLGLLLLPAWRLAEHQERRQAMALFNKASHYPLATLILVLLRMALP